MRTDATGSRRLLLHELTAAATRIHRALGEAEIDDDVGALSEVGGDISVFEATLHELAHHVCLGGLLTRKKRKLFIGEELEVLSPAARDGNEADAIAVTIETASDLGYQLKQSVLVRFAFAAGGMQVIPSYFALTKMVTMARRTAAVDAMSSDIARALRLEVAKRGKPLPR